MCFGENAFKSLILNSFITSLHQTEFKLKKAYSNSEEKIVNQH
jgi:hypothetical protein